MSKEGMEAKVRGMKGHKDRCGCLNKEESTMGEKNVSLM